MPLSPVSPDGLGVEIPMQLTHEQILFLAKLTASSAFKKALDEAHAVVEPGHHSVAPFCVEVGGAFDKAEDSERAGTVKALSLVTLAVALQHAGVTREAALDAIEHGLRTVGTMSTPAQRAFLRENPKVDAMHKRVTSALRKLAPPSPVKGSVKARGFVRPATEVVPSSPVVLAEDGTVDTDVSEIDEAIFLINAK